MSISEDVDRIVDETISQVDSKFAAALQYASDAWTDSQGHLSALKNALDTLKVKTLTAGDIAQPTAPAFGELMAEQPNFEDTLEKMDTEISNISEDLESLPDVDNLGLEPLPDVEAITITDPNTNVPIYNPPTEPTPYDETVPSMEPLNPVAPPAEPDEETFTKPAINYPVLPNVPSFTIPVFTASVDLDNIEWVIPSINWSESMYTSDFLTVIQNKLTDIINNQGVGMSATVQSAYYDKDLERAIQAKQDAIDNAIAEWATRGLDLPDGDIENKVLVIETEYLHKRLEVSREILVKNFELEYNMLEKALGHANTIEGSLIQYANNMQQRAFDAVKAIAELSINILNAEIARNNQRIEVFKAEILQWEGLLKGELAKLEIYKGQLEGVKAYVDVNESMVKLYQADITAYATRIAAYEALVKAKLMEFELEKTKLEEFKAKIEAYIAGINGKTAEYNMYRAQVDGRLAPFQAYESEMKGYGAYVQGKLGQLEADVKQMEAVATSNKEKLNQAQLETEAVKAAVTARGVGIDGYAKSMGAEAEIFAAIAKAYETLGMLHVKEYEANIQKEISQVQFDLQADVKEVENYLGIKQTYLTGMQAIAQMASQMFASAISSITAQATLTADGNASESFTKSETTDLTEA